MPIGVLDCPLEGEAARPDRMCTVGALPAVHARLAVVLRVISEAYAFATRPLGIILGLLALLALCPGETRLAHAISGAVARALTIAGLCCRAILPVQNTRKQTNM